MGRTGHVLARVFRVNTTLQHVEFAGSDFDDSVGAAWFTALTENDNTVIKSLFVSNCGFGPKTVAPLIGFMKKNKTLVDIRLWGNSMFDEESGKQFAETVDESSAPLVTLKLE